MTTFTYRAHGLTISSEIELHHLAAGDGPPDVLVRRGVIPEHLEQPVARGILFEASPRYFLLRIDGVARYVVSDGREITVDAQASAQGEDVSLFLIGSVFAALLLQRGLAPLHASAIRTERGAVMFAGPSGAGKSTLAAAFGQRGYDVLADDVAAIDASTDGACLVPAYSRLLLWPDAMARLGVPEQGARLVRKRVGKYSVPVEIGGWLNRVPVHTVYDLNPSNRDELSLTTLSGFEKVQTLVVLTYRRQFVPGLRAFGGHFDRVAALARRARVIRVVRPAGGFQIERLVTVLERDFLA